MQIANKYNLLVIEDAAQGVMASYKGKALGAIGHLGAYSFHETKNIISGEGGAILINDEQFAYRAEIIREKGTDRSQFYRGQVDKYTWQDIGSSYLPSEDIAAFLYAQLEQAEYITNRRMAKWQVYHEALEELEKKGDLRRPIIPAECQHNAHMYYILLDSLKQRTELIKKFKAQDIHPVFHYIPLHSAPAGKKYARTHGCMKNTDSLSDRLLRLPLWVGLADKQKEVLKVMGVKVLTGTYIVGNLLDTVAFKALNTYALI